MTYTRKTGTIMIKSFKNKETEKIFNQLFSSKISQNIQKMALKKLMMIDAAEKIEDLRVPPGNRLEALHGDREGEYSIRVNDQYRICFSFNNGDADKVEIVDYH